MARSGLKKSQRCASNAADGSRCAKFCAPGEVVCSKHRPDSQPVGIIALQHSDDPRVILRKLMKDRDPTVRLRAVNAWLDDERREEARGCAACAQRSDSAIENQTVVQYASLAQRAELRALLEAINNVKTAVREYIAGGGLPTQENESHATEQQYYQSPGEAPDLPTTSIERPDAAADSDEQVSVYRDGVLVQEPRGEREWESL